MFDEELETDELDASVTSEADDLDIDDIEDVDDEVSTIRLMMALTLL